MKSKRFVAILFFIYEISFYLVMGQTVEEISDCSKLMVFLLGNYTDYSKENCCDLSTIICDNERYIKSINLYSGSETVDFNSFPYFSRIEQLTINEGGLKEIPNSILNLTTLKNLDLNKNTIGNIPSGIKNISKLEKLYLSGNQIEKIPSDIKNIPQLSELNLSNNKIKELPNEIFSLKKLTLLDLNTNNIKDIPPAIKNFPNLEKLYLFNNDIEKLPNEVFSLTNLKEFGFQNNKNLTTKIIKFGDSSISNCNFTDVNIECYEPNTCRSIFYNNNKYNNDAEFQKVYRKCTEKEINDILSGLKINRKTDNSNYLLIILGCIIVIFIGVLVTFMLIRKKKSKKRYEIDSKNVFRTGSIRVVLNINNRNSSSNNTNVEIDNNNNNNQYNYHNSLDIQIPPPSYDNLNNTVNINNNNNNEVRTNNASIDEVNDSLPEYTIIDQLNE